MSHFICPVCDTEYDDYPYQEICNCGIQFGYEDAAGGDIEQRKRLYGLFREQYVQNGNKELTEEQILTAVLRSKD